MTPDTSRVPHVMRAGSHHARLCPSAGDCQDVYEVESEQSSDADSELCGLDGAMYLM